MKKKNCWEIKKMWPQPWSNKTDDLGVYPSAILCEYEDINRGKYAGRFCNEKIQDSFAKKIMNCLGCDFFKQVNEEEGMNFKLTPNDAKKIKKEEQIMKYMGDMLLTREPFSEIVMGIQFWFAA